MIQRRNSHLIKKSRKIILHLSSANFNPALSILKIDLLDFFVIPNTPEEVRSKSLVDYIQ